MGHKGTRASEFQGIFLALVCEVVTTKILSEDLVYGVGYSKTRARLGVP